MTPAPVLAILSVATHQERTSMNERSIVAAILAAGLVAPTQPGANFATAAVQAVSMYRIILAELAKQNLPPPQP